MVKARQMTTRVSPDAYKSLLQKCADKGCSTYEYLRQLVYDDVGVEVVPYVPQKPEEEPVQTELEKIEPVERGIKITRE